MNFTKLLRSYRHSDVLPVILMAPNLKPMAPLWMKVSSRHFLVGIVGIFGTTNIWLISFTLAHSNQKFLSVKCSSLWYFAGHPLPHSHIQFQQSFLPQFLKRMDDNCNTGKNTELLDFTYGYCRSCHLHSHSCCQTFSWSQQHLMGQVEFQPMSNFWEWGIWVGMGCKQ